MLDRLHVLNYRTIYLYSYKGIKMGKKNRSHGKTDWDVLRYKADGLKAMAHPTRLAILETLLKGEKCVCELVELLELEQAVVSKHLHVLKGASLVVSYKKGLKIYYSLACPCVADMLHQVSFALGECAAQQRKLLSKIH